MRHRTAAPSGALIAIKTEDDQEPRFVRDTRELPHGASEQVLEAPDEVVHIEARAVVRFARDELACGVDVRQPKNVKAAGRSLTVSGERRPAGDHRFCESVHVGPVLLKELFVVPEIRSSSIDRKSTRLNS